MRNYIAITGYSRLHGMHAFEGTLIANLAIATVTVLQSASLVKVVKIKKNYGKILLYMR